MTSTIKALAPTGAAIYFTMRDLEVLLYALRAEALNCNRDEEGPEIARLIQQLHHDTPAPVAVPTAAELGTLAEELAGAFSRERLGLN